MVTDSRATGEPTGSRTDVPLEVEADGVRAVLERAPFRLRFFDRDDREVLTGVPDAPRQPRRRLPVPDPMPFGYPARDPAPLYAPFTFMTGFDRLVQYRALFWIGDVFTGVRGGTEHALVNAVSVTPHEGGLLAEVTTTDPSGRRAFVAVTPDEGPAIKVSVSFSSTSGIAGVAAAFTSGYDEAFHGFGGRRNTTDQRGRRLTTWAEEFMQRPDQVSAVTRLPGVNEDWQFPTGAHGAYYVQPLFVSSGGYGFWVDQPELSRFRMAYDRPDAWHVSLAAAHLNFVVAPGDGPQTVRTLTAITGRQPVPPRWALGPMISRAVQVLVGTPERYESEVLADLDAVEKHGLDLTGFSIEGWGMLAERGSLPGIMERMRARGIRPVVYFKAFVGGAAGTETEGLYEEAIARGYVATTRKGKPYRFGSPLQPHRPSVLIDFTNPDAVAWWKRRVHEALDLGVEGWMQDFGEQTMVGMCFADGSTGAQMHNRYLVLYHKATREALEEYVQRHPDREPWFFVRSGYTGRPGSAAYEGCSWGGDNTTDWSRASGIRSVIPDMLNRGLGGSYGYATDIGGYVDTYASTDAELLTRWAQLAALIPVNRLHGGPNRGTHMPWNFGAETLERYRAATALHRRAQPLILRLWDEAYRTGMPICRPLWLHHPDDRRARAEEQQWLLGPDVLVAPVVEKGALTRSVYFPEGSWEHPETGDRYDGPAEIVVPAPLDRLPYFFRTGTTPFG